MGRPDYPRPSTTTKVSVEVAREVCRDAPDLPGNLVEMSSIVLR